MQEELEVANDENRHFCRTPGCRGILTVTVEQVQVGGRWKLLGDKQGLAWEGADTVSLVPHPVNC